MQVGDGTTSVVILAGELLKRLKPFVEEGKFYKIIFHIFCESLNLTNRQLYIFLNFRD